MQDGKTDEHEAFRKAGYRAIDDIIAYYRSLEQTLPADQATQRVVANVTPGYLEIPRLSNSGCELSHLMDVDEVMKGITHWQSPNFMAYFPANSSYPAILGDIYSDMFTCAAFNWSASPIVTELEKAVLENLGKELGLGVGEEGGGCIYGSASEATLTMMIAARDSTEGENKVILISDQTHSGAEKAAKLLNIECEKIDMNHAQDEIQRLRKEGKTPFFIVLTYGTTNTCAIEPMPDLDIWVHVDAAYAGAALLLDEYSLPGRFDSFAMNAHKWLLTNFDCTCAWIKDRAKLITAMAIEPAYLRSKYEYTDFRNWGIPLGRRFRALKLWFVLRHYGLDGLRNHIRRHIQYGETFADLVKADPHMVLYSSAFALTVFYFDKHTEEVYQRINTEGVLFLTSTVIDGRFLIRVVACSPFVQEEHLIGAYRLLARTYSEICRA